jgi:alpha-beta hydrolase superfamily lysophospholipase
MLGLAVRASELGLAAYAIDLRGHGENVAPLDAHVAHDVEIAIACARRHGRVAAIGHSLGGRLALDSSADYAIGIAPALASHYGPRTRAILGSTRDGRVRQPSPDTIFSVLSAAPSFKVHPSRPAIVIHGSRDLPEVTSACRSWAERGCPCIEIENALHGDICFLEQTFGEVAKAVSAWFPRNARTA